MRCRAMSFSSTSIECPFLLGEEGGTVPLGSALRNKLSLPEDGFSFFCCFSRTSFLASKSEQNEAKRSINRSSNVLGRAILWKSEGIALWGRVIVLYKEMGEMGRERERENLEIKLALRNKGWLKSRESGRGVWNPNRMWNGIVGIECRWVYSKLRYWSYIKNVTSPTQAI